MKGRRVGGVGRGEGGGKVGGCSYRLSTSFWVERKSDEDREKGKGMKEKEEQCRTRRRRQRIWL